MNPAEVNVTAFEWLELDRPAGPGWRARPATPRTCTRTIRAISINTHRGEGPKLRYLLESADAAAAERARLLHDRRAYAYHIAEWLARHRDDYDVVGLQEVWHGSFGPLERFVPRARRQREFYRVFSGYPDATAHRVGTSAFRYENVLLSRLPAAPARTMNLDLPGRVFRLATCGFTLAPFRLGEETVWVGNTHLHPYHPRVRATQAASIARRIRRLGDVPVLFLGDFNTVPPGCRDGDFPHGERDVRSYRDDRTLGILARAGLRMVAHSDDERFHTYPTGLPNRTLDYVLFSRHFDVVDYRVVAEFTLSDHYPVAGEFRLRP